MLSLSLLEQSLWQNSLHCVFRGHHTLPTHLCCSIVEAVVPNVVFIIHEFHVIHWYLSTMYYCGDTYQSTGSSPCNSWRHTHSLLR